MKHLGDITKISGYSAPIVDCIIGGSPCQDLSVAGKRAGLDGERSGLYIEQVRIVKEMRKRDIQSGRSGVDVRPRYMVWENVPGAFSSNKGEDFRIVLEELAKVVDKNAVIPRPDKWKTSGCIVGDNYSIAWRIMDSQFFGVPQRRRRIVLCADFNGHNAYKIVFGESEQYGNAERSDTKPPVGDIGREPRPEVQAVGEGVSGHPKPSEQAWEGTSVDAETGDGANDRNGATCYGISSFDSNSMRSDNPHSGIYEAKTSRYLDGNGGNPSCNQGGIAIVERLGADQYNAVILGDTVSTIGVNCGMSHGRQCVLEPMETVHTFSKSKRAQNESDYETWKESDVANTLNAFDVGDVRTSEAIVCGCDLYNQSLTGGVSKTLNSVATDSDHIPCAIYSVENHPADSRVNIDESGKVQTLTSRMGTGGGNVPMVLALDRASFNQGENAQYDFEISDKGINSPLVAKGPSAVCYWDGGQIAGTLTANNANGAQRMPDKDNFNCVISSTDLCLDDQGGQQISVRCDGKAPTLRAEVHGNIPCVIDNQVYSVDQGGGKSSCNVNEGQAPTLTCTHGGEPAVCYGKTRYIVRRLTPLECERLQGYPDGWTDIGEWIDSKGKKRQASDALRYKCLGNSIALPVWKVVLKRLCACYERDATMASLFDGIGGFPYLWEQINGKGSCLWASEIEEFPIAVTEARIGGD